MCGSVPGPFADNEKNINKLLKKVVKDPEKPKFVASAPTPTQPPGSWARTWCNYVNKNAERLACFYGDKLRRF